MKHQYTYQTPTNEIHTSIIAWTNNGTLRIVTPTKPEWWLHATFPTTNIPKYLTDTPENELFQHACINADDTEYMNEDQTLRNVKKRIKHYKRTKKWTAKDVQNERALLTLFMGGNHESDVVERLNEWLAYTDIDNAYEQICSTTHQDIRNWCQHIIFPFIRNQINAT